MKRGFFIRKKPISVVTTIATVITSFINTYAINASDASALSNKLENIINSYVMPFAGVLIFGGVVAGGILLIARAHRPKERAETMSGILWVAIGAIIIGMAALIAGVILGVSKS